MKKYTPIMLLCGLLMTAEGLDAGVAAPDKTPRYVQQPDLCGPWFSGLAGGPFWLQDVDVPVAPGVGADIEFDMGWGITVVPIGYRLSETFSLSFSAGYYTADFDSVRVGGVPAFGVGGDVELIPLMANAVFNFPVADRLSLYVGGGAGAVYSDVEVNVAGVAAAGDEWNFGLQGVAGLAYEIARCVHLTAGYRYQHTFADDDDLQGHSAELGVVIHW